MRFPNFDGSVPRASCENGVLGVRGESNRGNPVIVHIILNSELALSNCIPDLDVLVSATRSNLPVVS